MISETNTTGSGLTEATTTDRVRQAVVLVGAVAAVVAAAWGSGAFGGPSQPEVGDGALAPDATLLAPGRPAFTIWSVIYAGLVVWAVRQALPGRATDARERATGWLLLASMLGNAAWLAVVQTGLLGLSVPVIIGLLAVLVALMLTLLRLPAASTTDTVVMDGTAGLYLGWVCVATVANVAAVLADAGVRDLGLGAEPWAVIILTVTAAIGVALAVRTRGRLAIAAALAWGLAWIAVARSTGEPVSTPTAVAAGAAAAVVVGATVVIRLRRRT